MSKAKYNVLGVKFRYKEVDYTVDCQFTAGRSGTYEDPPEYPEVGDFVIQSPTMTRQGYQCLVDDDAWYEALVTATEEKAKENEAEACRHLEEEEDHLYKRDRTQF